MAKIQPGLERIAALLRNVAFPWKSIHVAGTNGKGSVCHYASSMLLDQSLKVGSFTSPHLVDRWDCISINGQPVKEGLFRKVEDHFLQVNKTRQIGASPFEILTATAFTIFNDKNVHVGIVEVGMGGKLDSTNILNNQAVSIITKIARDHEAFLGNTLAEIAAHKAGILRPAVPFIINAANEANVQSVIQDHARAIGAGPRLFKDNFELNKKMYNSAKWQRVVSTLPPFQQENLKLAVVAVMHILQSMNREIKPLELAKSLLAKTKQQNPGRLETVHAIPVFRKASEKKNHILVDGAHNPDAARALDQYVTDTLRYGSSPAKERPESGWPVTWVLAMTEGKDARQYLSTLLKPGDKVVATMFGPVDGMPWVKPMDPKELLEVAKSVEPQITGIHVPVIGPLRALCTAKYMTDQLAVWAPIVLTGSLYLVGDLHRELRPRSSRTWWTETDTATTADRESFLKVQAEERERVNTFLTSKASQSGESATEEQKKLQEELDALNREVKGLEIEEQRLAQSHSLESHDEDSLTAAERLERADQRFAEAHSTPEQIAAQMARAEKAEADLARHALKLEAAAKARAEKIAKRNEQRQRLEERRELKRQKRQLEKEQKRMQEAREPQDRASVEQPRQRSREHVSARKHDALSGVDVSRQGTRSFSRSRSPREEATSSVDESQDALLGILDSGAKNSFFGRSNRLASRTAPTDGPTTQLIKEARRAPHSAGQGLSPTPQRPGNDPLEQSSDGEPSEEKNPVRIHMHYANASTPRHSKMEPFPEARRTRSWDPPRGKTRSRSKSVVNYYAHEYGKGRGREE